MDISYKTQKMGILFNSLEKLNKKYGYKNGKLIMLRQSQMRNAQNLLEFSNIPPRPRCHELKHKKGRDLTEKFAASLDGSWRIIFEPNEDPLPLDSDGSLIWSKICAVTIIGVEDYHD